MVSASLGSTLRNSFTRVPVANVTSPPGRLPSRIFGPCRSTRIPMGRPTSRSSARTPA